MNLTSDKKTPAMEGVTLEAAGVLVELIGENEIVERSLLKRRFQERAQGFDVTLKFMNALRMLEISGRNICCTHEFRTMRNTLGKGRRAFARHIAILSAESNTHFGSEIQTVIQEFRAGDGRARLASDGLGGVYYAARNFLLETGALRFDHKSRIYRVDDWFYREFIRVRYSRGMTPHLLSKANQRQAEIGYAAEIAVYKYERGIVGKKDLKNVVHVALENVSAGFDIASVRRKQETDELYLRLIEVKAVSLKDWSFTLTKNEMQVAKEHEDCYFLYLVPVMSGKPKIEKMDVIQNPAKNLLNESVWMLERGDWNVCRVKHDG